MIRHQPSDSRWAKSEASLTPSNTASLLQNSDHATRIAAAGILLEVACSDHRFEFEEAERCARVLQEAAGLDQPDALRLLVFANTKRQKGATLRDFAQTIGTRMSKGERAQIVAAAEQIATADARFVTAERTAIANLKTYLGLTSEPGAKG